MAIPIRRWRNSFTRVVRDVSNTLVLTRLPAEVKAELHRYPGDLPRDPDDDRSTGIRSRDAEALATDQAGEHLGSQVPRIETVRRPADSRTRGDGSGSTGQSQAQEDFEVGDLNEDERASSSGRVLRRTRKRVDQMLTVIGAARSASLARIAGRIRRSQGERNLARLAVPSPLTLGG